MGRESPRVDSGAGEKFGGTTKAILQHPTEKAEDVHCPWCFEYAHFGVINPIAIEGLDLTQDFVVIGATSCCKKIIEIKVRGDQLILSPLNWKKV